MNPKELLYCARKMRGVVHATLNPDGPGAVRIHLVPPKFSLRNVPSVVILNGSDIIPINTSWAILLASFLEELNAYHGKEIDEEDLRHIVYRTMDEVEKIYPRIAEERLEEDLWRIISTLCDIAYGKEPQEEIGYVTLGEYAPHMKAPHRMDLMISAMTKDGKWNCNQKCLHCYACGQKQAEVQELSTQEWKKIIDKCKEAGIPQLTFTGGEPTMRSDLVELIHYAKWFVTRLNTNGVFLSQDLCERLHRASLDTVQITLYSNKLKEHNQLVGAENYVCTVCGIQNAIAAGLNVSVNTPLCTINRDYAQTLHFLKDLGVRYVTCSGLIVTGNAEKEASKKTQLSQDELFAILQEATEFCREAEMEISFTSPGWLPEDKIRSLRLTVPSCGACLSNMAIAPDGKVIPCQSWLNGEVLGDMRKDPWHKIWNKKACAARRKYSAQMKQECPLRRK